MPSQGGTPAVVEQADPARWGNWLVAIARSLNLALRGKLNAVKPDVTLTASATTTTVTDERIGVSSWVEWMPTTANGKTAKVAGIYVSDRTKGSLVLHHASAVAVDQTGDLLIVG